MIGVGINENVLISKAFINDKKRLIIELIPALKEKVSIFDSMLTAGVTNEGSSTMQLMILGPLAPKPKAGKDPMTKEAIVQMLTSDITRLRNQLTQILEQFMINDNIDLWKVQFDGTGITDSASLEARINDQDTLDKIYENICKRFIELGTPFFDKVEFAVRFKLLRQSKDKHYATIPSRFIADNPFIELMSVPKEQSNVKFTKYEVDQGLNDGTPITAATAAEAKDSAIKENTAAVEVNPFQTQ